MKRYVEGLQLETAATQDGKIHTVTQLGIAYIITLMTWISVFHIASKAITSFCF